MYRLTYLLFFFSFWGSSQELDKSISNKIDEIERDGNYQLEVGHYDSALFFFNKLLEIGQSNNLPQVIANGYENIGATYQHKSEFDSALSFFSRSLEIYEENGLIEKENLMSKIAIIYYYQGKYDKSIELELQTIPSLLASGNQELLANSYNGIGITYYQKGDYPKAISYYLKSLEIKKKLGLTFKAAETINNIGVIYFDQGNYTEALKSYTEALAIYKSSDDLISQGFMYANIGEVYEYRKQYDSALFFLRSALKISEKLNDLSEKSYNWFKLGSILSSTNQYDSAEYFLLKALEAQKNMGLRREEAESSIILGQLYAKMNETEKAIYHTEYGYRMAKELGATKLLKDAALVLAELNYEQGNLKDAYQYRIVFEAMHDTLFNENHLRNITMLEAEYQFNKEKDSINFAAEAQRIVLEQNIKKRKLSQKASIVGLILSVIVIVLLYRFYYLKQKNNQKLVNLNQEIHLQNIEIKSQRDHLEDTLDELKLRQAQIVQSEKMVSIGSLAAGVAHEINNPLNFINGSIEALRRIMNELPASTKEKGTLFLDLSQEGVDRAAKIVKSLNEFSTDGAKSFEPCGVNSILFNCIGMLKSRLGKIKVESDFKEEIYYVNGNKGSLHQLFVHILQNAIDSIADFGTISMSLKKKKKKITILIEDTGCGISKENLDRISDPFFTTKPPDVAKGLGLTMSQKIVKEHGGSITISSELNVGTKVTISLPLINEPVLELEK